MTTPTLCLHCNTVLISHDSQTLSLCSDTPPTSHEPPCVPCNTIVWTCQESWQTTRTTQQERMELEARESGQLIPSALLFSSYRLPISLISDVGRSSHSLEVPSTVTAERASEQRENQILCTSMSKVIKNGDWHFVTASLLLHIPPTSLCLFTQLS